jgi:hypothetical protein
MLALLVVVGLGSVAATIWIGSTVKEETVVANPYETGLRYDEERRARAAAAGLGDTAALPAQSAHGRGPAPPSARPEQPVRPERSGAERAAESRDAPRGDELTLTISPDPPRALSELTFTVGVRRDGAAVEGAEVSIDLQMPGMYMGENRIALAPAGGGLYRGTGTVVRCPSGKRRWEAAITARRPGGGAPLARTFSFEVAER